MDTHRIIVELRAERKLIEQAIIALEALDGTAPKNRAGRPPAQMASTPVRRHRMSAAGRRRISQMMKKRWAERKKKAKA